MCNCWWCPDNIEWVDQILYELAYDSKDPNSLCGEFYNLTCSLSRDDEQCDCLKVKGFRGHPTEIVVLRDPFDGTFFTVIDGRPDGPGAKTFLELRVILDRDYPDSELILDFD